MNLIFLFYGSPKPSKHRSYWLESVYQESYQSIPPYFMALDHMHLPATQGPFKLVLFVVCQENRYLITVPLYNWSIKIFPFAS